MAIYNVTNAKHGTLTAGAIDTINFPETGANHEFIITNRANSDYWVRFDGVDPVANADNSYIVPGQSTFRCFPYNPATGEVLQVRVTGGNNSSYSVQRV